MYTLVQSGLEILGLHISNALRALKEQAWCTVATAKHQSKCNDRIDFLEKLGTVPHEVPPSNTKSLSQIAGASLDCLGRESTVMQDPGSCVLVAVDLGKDI